MIFSSEQHNIFWSFDDCRGEWRDRWRRKNGGNSSVLVPFSSISLPISLNALLVDKITDSTSEQATHSSLLDIFSEEKEKKRIYFHLLHFPPFFSVCIHGLHTKYPSEEKNGGKSVLCILYINYVLHLNWTEHQLFGGYIHITYIGIVGEGEFGGRDFISWLYMKKVVESGKQRQHQSFSQKVKWKSKALKKVSKS